MRIAAIRFKLVPKSGLGGRCCRLSRTDDWLLWELSDQDATPEISETLNNQHALITDLGVWSGSVDDGGPWPTGTEPRQVSHLRYAIVPTAQAHILKGQLFVTYEESDGGVAMVPEPHFTPELRDDINADLADWVADGVWIRWRSSNGA